jgi:hypothetical protein
MCMRHMWVGTPQAACPHPRVLGGSRRREAWYLKMLFSFGISLSQPVVAIIYVLTTRVYSPGLAGGHGVGNDLIDRVWGHA